MTLKEISKDIYDVDTWLDEGFGKEGTPEREKNREKAWEEYNAQVSQWEIDSYLLRI